MICWTRLQGALTFCILISAPGAYAQNVRSWVASFGLDTNSCTRSSPCRTFGRAIATTNVNGEVVVLDSAGYGPFSIDKAVSVVSPAGNQAAVAPTAGNAITIAAGFAGPVVLRGLYLNGQGAITGIRNLSNTRVHVESCVVNGFDDGILSPAGPTPQFLISDSVIRNNQSNGILWASSGRAVIKSCRLEGNGDAGLIVTAGTVSVLDTVAAENDNGFFASTFCYVDIIDGAAVHNVSAGYRVVSTTGGAVMNVERSLSSSNGYGLYTETVNGDALLRVSNSVIVNNAHGVFRTGGPFAVIQSRGNNTLAGNNEEDLFTAFYNPQ